MNILKQSTAATIKLGPFVDDTDGKTAETALTIGQADIRLSKNGGDIAQTNNATGATHDELGYYDIPLDTTDTGTLGRLRVLVSKTGALPVWQEFLVVTANVYDTLCSTDILDVNVTAMAADVITASVFDESTAYPLKSADTGATAVARTGADSDTLETLSDQLDADVTLASTQGAITWGQQKIVANVANEGALDIRNTNAEGIGQRNYGTEIGQSNIAINTNAGENAIGQLNHGTSTNGDLTTHIYGQCNESVLLSGTAAANQAVGGYDPALALEATLTAIKGAGWTSETLAAIDLLIDAIKAKTDNLPASPAAVGSAMTLTAAYDKAKDDVLTPLAVVDGIVDAIKAQTDKIPATPASSGEYTTNIGAIKAKTDNLPLSPASSGEYTSALTAIQNDLDNPNQYKADVSNLALQATSLAIKGQTDKIPAAPAQTGEYNAALTAIQADLDNPTQYKADVSGLATTAHVQEVENKIDAIDVTVNTIPTNPLLDTAYTAPDNAGIAAIQEKTEQLTFTAPNKVDASATVDLTGIATSDDLDIIGGKVDGILNKLNVSSVEYVTAVVGSTITILRGDTLSARLLDLGDLTQYANLDFTVKRVAGELDDAAKIRLRKNASGTDDGLLRLNGAEHATATDGSIVIDDLATGDIEIKLTAAATQELVPGNYVYDVQLITANEVKTLTSGTCQVTADVTRATV